MEVTIHPTRLAVRTATAAIHPEGVPVHPAGVTTKPEGWTIPRPGNRSETSGGVRDWRAEQPRLGVVGPRRTHRGLDSMPEQA